MAITNLTGLYRKSDCGSCRMCDCCLKMFYNMDRYQEHLPCIPTEKIQYEVMPQDPILKFKDLHKCVDLTDVVYADSEAILEPVENGASGQLQKHIPCCFGLYWVSAVDGNRYHEFSG